MHIAQHTIWIARPRPTVFNFFTDFSQAPRWRQYVESMELLGDAAPRVGARFRTVLRVMGEAATYEMEVLAYEPPALWRHRSFENDFNGYVEYRFEEENGGTRVTMTMDVKPVKLYGWLAMPIIWLRRSKPYAEQLPSLKRVMESPPQ